MAAAGKALEFRLRKAEVYRSVCVEAGMEENLR